MAVDPARLIPVACNVCGRDDPRLYHVKAGLHIVQCRHCGLVYVHPRLDQDRIWDRYSAAYFWNEYLPAQNAAGGRVDLEWQDGHARAILNLIEPYRQKGRLLEVGCAAGFFLKAGERRGWAEVKGVEVMEAAVEFGREILGLDICHGTLEQAGLAEGYFDVVAMLDTVEHLLAPQEVLREAYRVLRPGGAVILTTPNLHSLTHRLFGVDWTVLGPTEHLYYFTVRTLARLLRSTGLREVRFAWPAAGTPWMEVMNPHNAPKPGSSRTRLARPLIRYLGPLCHRAVARLHLGDVLCVVAVK